MQIAITFSPEQSFFYGPALSAFFNFADAALRNRDRDPQAELACGNLD
jgi:hypothetical protein